MNNWKLLIEYEGTRYRGWQKQKNARTVAGEIRRAAEQFFQSRVDVMGAGRTDAGVHALGQVASLRVNKGCTSTELCQGVNDLLPEDIHILRAVRVSPQFEARRDAVGRYYLYQISQRRTAFAKRYVWWVKDRLDIARMAEGAKCFVGRHDFTAFCESRGDERSTVVEVKSAEIGMDGNLILFRIGASHFLWKMVRRIVGALVEVGRGNLKAADLVPLLKTGGRLSRSQMMGIASRTAPPSGLFLERVLYAGDRRPQRLVAAFPVAD